MVQPRAWADEQIREEKRREELAVCACVQYGCSYLMDGSIDWWGYGTRQNRVEDSRGSVRLALGLDQSLYLLCPHAVGDGSIRLGLGLDIHGMKGREDLCRSAVT